MIESPSPQHNTRRIDVGWCCSTATATAYDVPGLVVKPPRPALHGPRRRKERESFGVSRNLANTSLAKELFWIFSDLSWPKI
jgi:hypothetical protein